MKTAETLHTELYGLISALADELSDARAMKNANDRVDAITLVVRKALRAGSLCFVDGGLHHFNGNYYAPVDKGLVLAVLGNILVDMGVSPTDVRKMGEMPLSVIVEKSHPRFPFLLCFDNGILDVRGPEFADGFNPRRIVTERLPYTYDPSASCSLWLRFLSEVLPDESERRVLQEFFGMCYIDRSEMSVEKFAILVGGGANGKSVIFEVIKRVVGPDNVSTFDSVQLGKENMIPYVKGKRLNFAPDMRKSSSFDSSLKAIASGQDVTGRRIYGDAEKIKCPPLVFALNEMPRFADTSDAFFRRLLLFSFDVTIPPEKQDRLLVERICQSDLPGIFNWILEGRMRLVRNHGQFSESRRMDNNLTLLRESVSPSSSPVRHYLASRGLGVYPIYEGQPFTSITQREIVVGLGGQLSPNAVTREMNRYGVSAFRSKELFYRVYQL